MITTDQRAFDLAWRWDHQRLMPRPLEEFLAVFNRRKKEAQDGNRPLCAAVAVHLFRGGVADPVSRGYRLPLDAVGHISADRYPGRHGDLAGNRPEHAGDGAARYDL